MYRVDKNEGHDLETERRVTERGLRVPLYAWEPKWVNFRVWHGRETEGRSRDLKELMTGSSVVFRYFLSTGGYKETTFSLAGAGPAIADALGIALYPDSEARAGAFRAAHRGAFRTCRQDMRTFRACFERLASCERQAQRQVEAFEECMK